MYGYERAEELVGARVRDLMAEDPRTRELMRSFIRSGYRLTDAESLERDKEGQQKWFWNNILGVVENGRLMRAWGTQRDITFQKQVEAAQRRSEERLQLALDAGKLATWDVDLAQDVARIDARGAELFGLPQGTRQISAEEFRRTIHPSDRAMVNAAIQSAVKGSSDYAVEFRIVRPDHSIRWIAAKGDVVRNQFGHPVRMAGVNFDVTDRKEAEEKFRLLANNMPQLAWMTDHEGKAFWFNQRWLDYTGLTLEEANGSGWKTILHPVERKEVEARVEQHLQRGIPWEETFLMQDKDGFYRWFLTRAVPACDESGKVTRWLGTSTDITGQREAASALQQTIERLHLLSNTARQLLVTSDNPLHLLDNIFQTWARQLELDYVFLFTIEPGQQHLTLRAARGISKEQAETLATVDFGQAACGLLAHEMSPKRLSKVQDSVDPRTKFIRELGITAYVCHPLLSHQSQVGSLCFGTHRRPSFPDETVDLLRALADMVASAIARKQSDSSLEEARKSLEAHNQQLEHHVTERTASLNASLRSVEELLYTIAHDLRAPNRAMSGFASMLEQEQGDRLDPKGRDYLRRISEGALKSDRLITDLLRYGRLSHADLPVKPTPLKDAIREAVRSIGDELKAANAEVVLDSLDGTVLANSSALGQILTNLLTNALKYVAPDVRPRIEVSTVRTVGGYTVRVQDNGIGIPHEHHGQIFQPFIRLNTLSDQPGTGIGLAIVRKAAERLNGKVGVESSQGDGSCFWVELPTA
jgi:PAS domain S-box-containing protein